MKTLTCITFTTIALAPLCSALDLVPFGTTWDYMQRLDNADPEADDPDFNSTWFLAAADFVATYDGPAFGADPTLPGPPVNSGTGSAPLGYGAVTLIDNDFGGFTTTLTLPDEGSRQAAYFRTEFTTTEDIAQLALEILADDAAVVYLNGTLLTQINYNGEDVFDGLSILVSSETETVSILGGLGGLAAGTHTLAVSVHQFNDTSSDLALALRLSDDGLIAAPLGSVNIGGIETPLFPSAAETEWIPFDNNRYLLNNAESTLSSERIDITGLGDLLFTAQLRADETSNGSNFEANDTFTARIDLDSGGVVTESISLIPLGADTNGDGALGGQEVNEGRVNNAAVSFELTARARIPSGFTGATLVIDGVNNSFSETFSIDSALITEAPPLVSFGTNAIGTAVDITAPFGLAQWTESDTPQTFVLNAADFAEPLISEIIDVSGAPQVAINLVVEFSETSTSSNFEAPDTFQGRIETVDADGRGSIQQLVVGGLDTDGNNVISGDEIALGVDVSESVSVTVPLSVRLPVGTVSAQLIILADNNAASEFYTLSQISAVAAAPDFSITDITRTGTEVFVSFESETGITYELQFSPDLTEDSFTTVATTIADSPSTTLSNDPGTAMRGFFRVVSTLE